MKTTPGKVYLVGAGPGDPGLITVKGKRCLEEAQVVVYDRLMDPSLLRWAPESAQLVFVGKERGRQAMTQDEINRFLVDRAAEILEAAGAQTVWKDPVRPQSFTAHLLGTCRMGNDPATSVVDKYHRTHDVPNLFICDGSSLVTSGRGQPTETIQALAFRAAEHISRLAKNGEI